MRNTELSGRTETFAAAFQRTAEELVRKPPNKEWLVAMLATMEPDNPIFRKDYVKPKPVSRFAELEQPDDTMENVDEFFSGLPLAVPKKGSKATIRFNESTAASEQHKLRKMQMQKAILDSRIATQQQRVPLAPANVKNVIPFNGAQPPIFQSHPQQHE